MSNCSNCKWDPDCVKYETLYPENCPDFELKYSGSNLNSTSEVKYGKCPQCGESYQINTEPHFCPPKKRLPTWLKNILIKQICICIDERTQENYDQWSQDDFDMNYYTERICQWVLSLEDTS